MKSFARLQLVLDGVARSVHSARCAAVGAAVRALIRGGRLPLTALGRAIAGPTKQKHGIKRIDRLLGNAALHGETLLFYRALADEVIQQQRRPIVLIDWTESGAKRCTLAAAIPFDGRALVVYAETHADEKLGNPSVQSAFLSRLREVLPRGCRPVIVADAGFCISWFRQVLALGWDYVGRLRGGMLVRQVGDDRWVSSKQLYLRARRRARELGEWELARSQQHRCRVVAIDRRSSRARQRSTVQRRGICERRSATSAREPWLLVTSLFGEAADQIVAHYRQRMQIEQTFRDTKSHRFGWSFEDVHSRSTARVDVLLLLAALATFTLLVEGIAAEKKGLHRGLQANTIRHRRVLSLVTLGRLVLSTFPDHLLRMQI